MAPAARRWVDDGPAAKSHGPRFHPGIGDAGARRRRRV